MIWIRDRLRRDEGMTLVELMVAVLILGVVLSALASVLITTGMTIVRTERVTGAQQIASSTLEELQAVDWDTLGHTSADLTAAGHGTSFEGEDYVVAAPSAGGSVPVTEVLQLDGVDYTVERHVTWANDGNAAAGANQNGDYKRLTTIVSTEPYGDPQTYRLQATRAPAPTNALRVFAIDTFEVTPDVLEYTAAGVPSTSTLDVTAVFSLPADTAPQLVWSSDGGATEETAAVMTSVDGGYTWTAPVSTTASGSRRFPDGAALFTVRGTHQSTLDAEAEFTVEVLEEGAPPTIEYGGLTAAQFSTKADGSVHKTVDAPICLKNGEPGLPVVLDAEVRGLGSIDEGRVGITWLHADDATTAYPVDSTDPKGYEVLPTTFDRVNAAGDGSWFRLTITNTDASYGFIDGKNIEFRVHLDDDDDDVFEAGETMWESNFTMPLYASNPC